MKEDFDNEDDFSNPEDEDDEVTDIKEAMRELKREFRDQMKDLKDELSDIKEETSSSYGRRPRRERKRKEKPRIHIETDEWSDWGDRFGASLEHYIGGILNSIGETIDRSVGSIFHGPSPSKRRRKTYSRRELVVPEEELEEFYQKGSEILSALSDQTRLKMLKELEKDPLRQSELSIRTETKGGNFKHHISILIKEGLVRQEGVRERYMLTFAGREALKLVEFLYSRSKKRISVPVEIKDNETEERENNEESSEGGSLK